MVPFSSLGKMPSKFLSLSHYNPAAGSVGNREHLERPSFLSEVIREGILKEVIFYPSLKDCIGIRPLENDRAGVLDRENV